jgi:hypothetical protein
MIYVGIDPGVNGGLAAINGTEVRLNKMPYTERDVWEWLEDLKKLPLSDGDWFACVEWIHPAIFQIGKSSMSKLYGSYMALRMALTAADIPFESPKPVEWQRGLGIAPRKKKETDTHWKNRLKAKAQQLFPAQDITLHTGDALLLAEYCRRKREGKL